MVSEYQKGELSVFLAFLSLVVIIGGTVLTNLSSKSTQDIRSQAEGPTGIPYVCKGDCVYSVGGVGAAATCYRGYCLDPNQSCSFNINCGWVGGCTGQDKVLCPGYPFATITPDATIPTATIAPSPTIDPSTCTFADGCSNTCGAAAECTKCSNGSYTCVQKMPTPTPGGSQPTPTPIATPTYIPLPTLDPLACLPVNLGPCSYKIYEIARDIAASDESCASHLLNRVEKACGCEFGGLKRCEFDPGGPTPEPKACENIPVSEIEQSLQQLCSGVKVNLSPFPTPDPSSCVPLETSGSKEDKLDIIFLPEKYTDKEQFLTDARKAIEQIKATNLGDRLQKFNFMANTDISNFYNIQYTGGLISPNWDDGKARDIQRNCRADIYQIILNVNEFIRGRAWKGGGSVITKSYFNVPNGNISPHELGHSIAQADDEYGYSIPAPANYFPAYNCSSEKADKVDVSSPPCPKWANDFPTAECIPICSYNNWYRSTWESIMSSPTRNDFNLVTLKMWDEALINFK